MALDIQVTPDRQASNSWSYHLSEWVGAANSLFFRVGIYSTFVIACSGWCVSSINAKAFWLLALSAPAEDRRLLLQCSSSRSLEAPKRRTVVLVWTYWGQSWDLLSSQDHDAQYGPQYHGYKVGSVAVHINSGFEADWKGICIPIQNGWISLDSTAQWTLSACLPRTMICW